MTPLCHRYSYMQSYFTGGKSQYFCSNCPQIDQNCSNLSIFRVSINSWMAPYEVMNAPYSYVFDVPELTPHPFLDFWEILKNEFNCLSPPNMVQFLRFKSLWKTNEIFYSLMLWARTCTSCTPSSVALD